MKSTLLRHGMKAAALLVVTVLVFSPLTELFQSSTAYAAVGGNAGQQEASRARSACESANAANHTNNDCTKAANDAAAAVTNGDGGTVFNAIASFLAYPIYIFTVGLGGFAASVGGYLFNVSIYLSLSSSAYGLDFVTDGWGAARDLANMFFILILIYIAVTVMLEAETGHTMNALVRVLFIALIINFSFFATRVVIDAGNFTATQFYNQIKAVDKNGQPEVIFGRNVKDLSASVMGAVGAQDLIGSKSFDDFSKRSGGFGEFIVLVVIYLFLGAAYFVLAATFVATAIKFIMRIAVLWLTIVASPLALVAYTVPSFEGQFKRWQETLISHAFFPVVFLFIFWLISIFAGGLNLSESFTSYLKVTDPNSAANVGNVFGLVSLVGSICIKLGFLVALLYLGLRAADQVGIMGAQWANTMGNKLSFGTIGFAGRNTVGRLGLGLSRNEGLRDWASKSAVGSAALRGAGLLSRGSFDLRSLPGAGKLKGQIGEAGGKGGIAKWEEERDKKREHRIEELGKAIKGDIKNERIEQEKFIAKYERDHGAGSYQKDVEEISKKISGREKEAKALREQAKTAPEALRNQLHKDAKVIDEDVKNIKKDLTEMTEAGKSTVKHTNHERSEVLAARLSNKWNAFLTTPSRGTLKGIAHLTHHESKEEKLAKAAKDFAKDDEGGGHTPPAATPPPVTPAPDSAPPSGHAPKPDAPAGEHRADH
ncbi:MAG TPA: hypothetical protein VHD55_02180 [Candidatus Paceibacterota bacterium]|nr:hypothetical protein [Candidatus Paceibacterota bacterium]